MVDPGATRAAASLSDLARACGLPEMVQAPTSPAAGQPRPRLSGGRALTGCLAPRPTHPDTLRTRPGALAFRTANCRQPLISNPEIGLPSHRLPKIARDPVIHLKGDSYPFEDRDLGRVLRPALTTEHASEPGNSAARTDSDFRRR